MSTLSAVRPAIPGYVRKLGRSAQRILSVLFAGTAVALAGGCASAPQYAVSVNSFAAPEAASKRSYIVLPAVDGITAEDFQFREAKRYLDRVLASRGFIEAASIADANVAVFLSYGIGEPKTSQYSYSLPMFGQTGGGTGTFNATTFGAGGVRTTSGTVTQPATFGVTGYISGTNNVTTFTRWVRISGVDLDEYRRTEKMVDLWDTRILSSGTSGDLRRALPVMIGASRDHIASDTGRFVDIQLSETDKRVAFVAGSKP